MSQECGLPARASDRKNVGAARWERGRSRPRYPGGPGAANFSLLWCVALGSASPAPAARSGGVSFEKNPAERPLSGGVWGHLDPRGIMLRRMSGFHRDILKAPSGLEGPFGSSMHCIIDTVGATTRLGSTSRPFREQRGGARASSERCRQALPKAVSPTYLGRGTSVAGAALAPTTAVNIAASGLRYRRRQALVTSGMNQTLGTLVSAQNAAQNGHYRRTQAYDFHH